MNRICLAFLIAFLPCSAFSDSASDAAAAAAAAMGQSASPSQEKQNKPFQPVCFVSSGIQGILMHDYHQGPIVQGVDSEGMKWAIWEDAKGNFSVLNTTGPGMTCIVAVGANLKVAPQK